MNVGVESPRQDRTAGLECIVSTTLHLFYYNAMFTLKCNVVFCGGKAGPALVSHFIWCKKLFTVVPIVNSTEL